MDFWQLYTFWLQRCSKKIRKICQINNFELGFILSTYQLNHFPTQQCFNVLTMTLYRFVNKYTTILIIKSAEEEK